MLTWNRPKEWRSPVPITAVAAIRQKPDSGWLPVAVLAFAIVSGVALVVAAAMRRFRIAIATGICIMIAAVAWVPVGEQLTKPSYLPVSDDEAAGVFEQLHDNVYAAFRRRTEESIYDGLETSVHGDLLRRIYLEMRRGLANEDDGGGTARIDLVQRLELRRTAPVSSELQRADTSLFGVNCSWKVVGRVEHWGHVHVRDVVYRASFNVADTGEHWKLAGMKAFSQTSVNTSTQLSK